MTTLVNLALTTFLFLGGCQVGASPLVSRNVWTKHGPELDHHSQLVHVNHHELAKALQRGLESTDRVDLTFDFFDGPVDCTLHRSSVMHPDLAAQYPEIFSLVGMCNDEGTSVALTINTDSPGSFSATAHHKAGLLFMVDREPELSTDPNVFHVHLPIAPTHDVFVEDDFDVVYGEDEDERKLQEMEEVELIQPGHHRKLATLEAFKFRLAIVTTAAYSSAYGNTIPSVLTQINAVMSRVNSIFLREMGIMFELIPTNDQIICLDGEADCAHLADSATIFSQTGDWIVSRGVSFDDFDLGHHFTGQSSGSAYSRRLCGSPNKLKATSGILHASEAWFALLVSHEMGHQIGGSHTFRDCKGLEYRSYSALKGVEPGSGSTIMSYTGSCGSENNLQRLSDPYYNSYVLVKMRQYVEDTVSATGCGTEYDMTGVVQPIMSTLDTCTVPRGNYVQLGGSIQNAGSIADDTYIAWDRIDPGYYDYSDLTAARFAPLTPSPRSLVRFLPNMYVLSFNPDQKVEIEPKDGYGDQTMTFRFIGRTKYHATDIYTDFDVALAGTFGYMDMNVTFDDALTPLALVSPPTVLTGQSQVTLAWSGGTSGNVELLVALNTMTEVAEPDFDEVVEDLNFVSMGVFPNTGSATVTVPQLSNPSNLPMNLMIRSGPNECYFFDLAAGIEYSPGLAVPTAEPSAMPSPVPSAMPSVAPSHTPSLSPSAVPSGSPSTTPSGSPSALGSAAPTASKEPTSSPSNSPSDMPSTVPSLGPSSIPSAGPSDVPTSSPSDSPSNVPTLKPSMLPTQEPSESPSSMPTDSPSMTPSSLPSVSAAPSAATVVVTKTTKSTKTSAPTLAPVTATKAPKRRRLV